MFKNFIAVRTLNMGSTVLKLLYFVHIIGDSKYNIVQQIPRAYSPCLTSFIPVGYRNTPISVLPNLWQLPSTLSYYECNYFRYLVLVESCSIFVWLTDLIYLA